MRPFGCSIKLLKYAKSQHMGVGNDNCDCYQIEYDYRNAIELLRAGARNSRPRVLTAIGKELKRCGKLPKLGER